MNTLRLRPLNIFRGYDKLEEGHFRLLEIRSVDFHLVRCHLETVSFAEAGAYDALSYVWGRQPRSKTIWNGSHAIKVTPDLEESLTHFYRHKERFGISRLWIDAVCINQEDEAEKMVQIQQMHYIYSNATQTLVWLGMSSYDSGELFAYMTKAIRLQAELPKQEFYDFQRNSSELLNRTLELFYHDWFERLWVIQEVVLARNVTFVYGTSVIPWDILRAYRRITGHLVDDKTWDDVRYSFYMRSEEFVETDLPLILDMARKKKTTYEKDHILGIIGILKSREVEALKNMGALSTTDCEHWTTFFTRFLGAFITSYLSISDEDMLAFLYDIFDILGSAWTAEKHEGLPSWCPDWTKPQPRYNVSARKPFQAGCRKQPDEQSDSSLVPLTLGTLNLRVHAFPVDVIESAVSYPGNDWSHRSSNADILEWAEECLKIYPGFDPARPQEVPGAFWRTLVCDRLAVLRKDCSHAKVQYYYDWISWLWAESGRTVQSEDNHLYDGDRARTYSVLVGSACDARKFFTTRDGRVGLGSLGVEAGDRVCIFYEARACFIVRFDQGEHAPALLMGDAYVHGLMEGEAVEGRPEPDDSFIVLR